jgi:hypothetical protein
VRSATFSLRVVETGDVLVKFDHVPIDESSGSVILLCSPHYASMPHDVVASVVTRDEAGAEAISEYTIRHQWVK